jgi:hypothetical protein
MLLPQHGDVVECYLHEYVDLPWAGYGPLLKKVDGHCVYLVDGKCSIWERAPAICKTFDFPKFFLSRPRAERRRLVKAGLGSQALMKADRDRLHTLEVGI